MTTREALRREAAASFASAPAPLSPHSTQIPVSTIAAAAEARLAARDAASPPDTVAGAPGPPRAPSPAGARPEAPLLLDAQAWASLAASTSTLTRTTLFRDFKDALDQCLDAAVGVANELWASDRASRVVLSLAPLWADDAVPGAAAPQPAYAALAFPAAAALAGSSGTPGQFAAFRRTAAYAVRDAIDAACRGRAASRRAQPEWAPEVDPAATAAELSQASTDAQLVQARLKDLDAWTTFAARLKGFRALAKKCDVIAGQQGASEALVRSPPAPPPPPPPPHQFSYAVGLGTPVAPHRPGLLTPLASPAGSASALEYFFGGQRSPASLDRTPPATPRPAGAAAWTPPGLLLDANRLVAGDERVPGDLGYYGLEPPGAADALPCLLAASVTQSQDRRASDAAASPPPPPARAARRRRAPPAKPRAAPAKPRAGLAKPRAVRAKPREKLPARAKTAAPGVTPVGKPRVLRPGGPPLAPRALFSPAAPRGLGASPSPLGPPPASPAAPRGLGASPSPLGPPPSPLGPPPSSPAAPRGLGSPAAAPVAPRGGDWDLASLEAAAGPWSRSLLPELDAAAMAVEGAAAMAVEGAAAAAGDDDEHAPSSGAQEEPLSSSSDDDDDDDDDDEAPPPRRKAPRGSRPPAKRRRKTSDDDDDYEAPTDDDDDDYDEPPPPRRPRGARPTAEHRAAAEAVAAVAGPPPRYRGRSGPSGSRKRSRSPRDLARPAPAPRNPDGPPGREEFPRKLRRIVQDHADRATWSKRGRSVTIEDRFAFATEVLPLYFRSTSEKGSARDKAQRMWESFARQMNYYGFFKDKSAPPGTDVFVCVDADVTDPKHFLNLRRRVTVRR